MENRNFARHSIRLNLQNEQHSRIHGILISLDKSIHKSANQFIINAIEFYINSFEDDEIFDKGKSMQRPEYITTEHMAEIRREMESGLKDEIIRLLGSALISAPIVRAQEGGREITGIIDEKNPVVSELAGRWG
ncbi:MAG: hypothetical protein NC124_05550 [Clostridium sp.]|nr:hypothetical protein [Clostridium sp.]MCM1550073.1 hypothetical protein [Clostridium sp.]